MSVRSMALTVSGAVVLGASLYLFVKVRAAPAPAAPTAAVVRPTAPPPSPATGATDPWAAGAIESPQARAERVRADLVPNSVERVEPRDVPPPTVPPPPPEDNSNVDDELKNADGLTVANKMFDRGDYDDAMKQAMKMLEKDPTNSRMLRIVVSSACFMGDPDKAQTYWAKLTDERDKAQMSVRCGRYGITFKQ